MASKRATVYLREQTLETIGKTAIDGLSSRIAAMLARYESVCRELMPTFSRAQWCAIMDANNGGSDLWITEVDGYPSGTAIWANVHDSRGLEEKWEIDQAALVSRLQQLSRAELLAVDEAIARFWAHAELPTDEALAAAWCTVEESQ